MNKTALKGSLQGTESSGTKANLAAHSQGAKAGTLRINSQGNETANQKTWRMTVKDLARQFGCDVHTITNHANRLFPGKIRNGVKTFFDEREVTLILESIKNPVTSGAKSNLVNEIQGTETALSPALKLEMLYRQIDEIKTAEIARLNADLAAARRVLDMRTAGLETIQRIAEAGGLVMSDRDDIEATYRRRR